MSCWIVSENHINAIAEVIAWRLNVSVNTGIGIYINKDELERVFSDCKKETKPGCWSFSKQAIVDKLLGMNVKAYEYRYSEVVEIEEYKAKETENMLTSGKLIAFVKVLGCYLYQCCEGDFPESGVFKVIENMQTAVKNYYISHLPEYEETPWGI